MRFVEPFASLIKGYSEARNIQIDIWGWPATWESIISSNVNEYGEVPAYPELSPPTEINLAFVDENWIVMLNTLDADAATGFSETTSINAGVRSDLNIKMGDRISLNYDYQGETINRKLEVVDVRTLPYFQQFTSTITLARWRDVAVK